MSVMMKYAYLNDGAGQSWEGGPPRQSRAADAKSLGSLSGTTLADHTLKGSVLLPAPGAPEPIGVAQQGMGGCSCSGSCGCGSGSPLSDFVDSVPGGYVTLGVAGILAWHFLRKR
jgi:hypothetical protein